MMLKILSYRNTPYLLSCVRMLLLLSAGSITEVHCVHLKSRNKPGSNECYACMLNNCERSEQVIVEKQERSDVRVNG